MRHVVYFLGLSLGVVALGCSSSATTTTVIVRPELVAVSPDDFLGALQPIQARQVQSYVATLFDVSPDTNGSVPDPGFQLASSPATYLLPVTFSFVITGHRYLAQVDVYDRALQSGADAGSTAGGADAGSTAGGADAGSTADASDKADIVPSTAGGRLQFDTGGMLVSPLAHLICGGYPATPGDGGSFGGAGSLGGEEVVEAGAAGADSGARTKIIALPPGVLTYDGITQTAHNCVELTVTN
ncbi:MAG TPA: hypothetical protein VIK01_04005 [Polyangiaceae bacterium]